MAIDVKNKGCNTGFSRASLNSRISGRLQEPKKYIRIRGEDFFYSFLKISILGIQSQFHLYGCPPENESRCSDCFWILSPMHRDRCPFLPSEQTPATRQLPWIWIWTQLYTVCSPASMAMAVFIPLCVAAIGSVLFVNWDRHCWNIMNRFVWFCIVSRLYGFVTRYLLIRRTLPWISLRHPSGFPNHPHYLHIGQRRIKDTLIHESTAQCTWITHHSLVRDITQSLMWLSGPAGVKRIPWYWWI